MKKESEDFRPSDIKQVHNWFLIHGEYYYPKMIDGKPIFEKQDKKEIENLIKMAEEIAEKIKEGFDPILVLKEAILKLSTSELIKLYDTTFNSKRKYKPKTREGHCVDMKIGHFILPIID